MNCGGWGDRTRTARAVPAYILVVTVAEGRALHGALALSDGATGGGLRLSWRFRGNNRIVDETTLA